jgi:hypothetical protein
MKIEPSFPDHWKTKRLQRACGAEAVIGLLRLWGAAKIKRQFAGLDLSPAKLAAIMDYPGDPQALWEAMTDPHGAWLDPQEGGTWALHGFAEHQRQIIAMWKNGKRGGRPAKSETPPSTPPSLNTSSSSSSSPIRFQNETIRFRSVSTPTLEEWVSSCNLAGIESDLAEEIWHDNEGRGYTPEGHWIDYKGNAIKNPVANAKSRANAMKARRKPSHNGHNGHAKPESVWSLQQRIEAATKEIERIQSNPSNKEQIPNSFDRRLKPEHLAKVKALKASISEMRQRMAGVEVAA